jgi:hypothetical protein
MDDQVLVHWGTDVPVGPIKLALCNVGKVAGNERLKNGFWVVIIIGFEDFDSELHEITFQLSFDLDCFEDTFFIQVKFSTKALLLTVRFLA